MTKQTDKQYITDWNTILKRVRQELKGAAHDHESITSDIWLYAWERGLKLTAQLIKWRVIDHVRITFGRTRNKTKPPKQMSIYRQRGVEAGEINCIVAAQHSQLEKRFAEIDTHDLIDRICSFIPSKALRDIFRLRACGASWSQILAQAKTDGRKGGLPAIMSYYSINKPFLRTLIQKYSAEIPYRAIHITAEAERERANKRGCIHSSKKRQYEKVEGIAA